MLSFIGNFGFGEFLITLPFLFILLFILVKLFVAANRWINRH